MSTFLSILEHWSLGLLGVILFVLFTLHKRVLQPDFRIMAFISKYRLFWIITVCLHLVISILVEVAPGIKATISGLGFAVDTHRTGWVLLGINLAAATAANKKVKKGVKGPEDEAK